MCGRAYDPRFLFTWPNAKIAVMGPKQLAGVMSIVRRGQAAAATGEPFDEEADAGACAAGRGADRGASRSRSSRPARLCDDGIIDPRDTRTVLGIALSAVHNERRRGRRGFGVFRM